MQIASYTHLLKVFNDTMLSREKKARFNDWPLLIPSCIFSASILKNFMVYTLEC